MRKRSQEEVVKEVNELTNGFYGTEELIYKIHNTAGTAGINACGDMITSLDGSAQEAPSL